MNLEGSVDGLIETLARHLRGGTWPDHENFRLSGVSGVSQTKHLPNINLRALPLDQSVHRVVVT